jgi:acetyl esterase/lipase
MASLRSVAMTAAPRPVRIWDWSRSVCQSTSDTAASRRLRLQPSVRSWTSLTAPGSTPGSAVLYTHGGGMIMGSLDVYDEVMSWYVARTGAPFLAVGYRVAPEVAGSTLAEDVFAASVG